MKFLSLLLKKHFFFLPLFIALAGTLPSSAQQDIPLIDVDTIRLFNFVNFRNVCLRDSLRKITPDQLSLNNFTAVF